VSVALSVAAFGAGVWLLVESVEGLLRTVRGWAAAAGMSGVVLAALVLGFDVESTAAGVAATLDDLPGTALGSSIGAAIFLLTVGLGAAAVVAPFRVSVPPALLAAPAIATVAAVALLLDGRLSRVDGVVLVGLFPLLVAAIFRSRGDGLPQPEVPDDAPRHPWLRVAAGLAGLTVGAELLVFGTERIVEDVGISETVFGLLVVAAAVSFEELVLELLPAYRGYPEVAAGNALGTLVFLLTLSLGAIALARPVEVPDSVRELHAPALVLVVAVALAMLARGRLGRPEGAFLFGLYALYGAAAALAG
jgi:cation:H+ antiporter